MLRTPVSSRPVRAGIGAAALTAAGVALLAGCATAADTTDTSSDSSDTSTDTGSSDAGTATYADGTYTAEGSYSTPESVEQISVTVTLESDVITSVEVVGDPQKAESKQYQSQFIGGISDAVVGQDIDEISVSRVAGSSLTSGGFNDAIETIKADAAA
ncbi:uncharacterized protein with FMN-binding domain [Microbacterium terrae]|uniref:Uncharacterized protein n=1 Tax=Microbacterium terrae TaxID=69369 RepID=A0A0M2H5T8_9MICO|nr:hypothetical protein [Microbacterium terrae]KJL39210.1 hypothetical protein RS81_02052 [Microbacterium terrae]MBP1076856.1 uncharacterized protein with FMN-binding domain [Microbacterium terrae]GLJ99451.1 hypothetical protein GCM10017594_26490 [Microbacterium terrae]